MIGYDHAHEHSILSGVPAPRCRVRGCGQRRTACAVFQSFFVCGASRQDPERRAAETSATRPASAIAGRELYTTHSDAERSAGI
jgi:hypothetical protein